MTLPRRKLGGTIGLEIDLESLGSELRTDTLLFSESPGFLLEADRVHAGHIAAAARTAGVEAHIIGKTSVSPSLTISRNQKKLLREQISDLRQIWKCGLKTAAESRSRD